MALITTNETYGSKFMNNRPLSISDEVVMDGTGTSEHTFYFHIMETGALWDGSFYVSFRQVLLFLYGYAGGGYPEESHVHPSVGNHTHPCTPSEYAAGTSGTNPSHGHGNAGLDPTVVPKHVEIWIDGTERTLDIGNPNSKTHYDTVDGWGDDGTNEWSTGRLDITDYVDPTVQDHYITIKETGGEGGRVQYCLYIT